MRDKDLTIGLYQAVHEADKPRVYKHWHCSAIAKCPTEHYLTRLGVPSTRQGASAAKKLRWQVGHSVEEAIRPYVQKMFPGVVSNMRLTSQEYDLTGELDNYHAASGRIVEIKSVHPFAFGKGDDTGLRDEQQYLHHDYQNHAYALLLEEAGMPCEAISFVYVALDGRLDCYTRELDDEISSAVLKRLDILNDAWTSRVAPECFCLNTAHPLFKPQMQYCEYQNGVSCCEVPELVPAA